MIPRRVLATAQVPGGAELQLVAHDRDFMIVMGGNELMTTRMHNSEEALAVETLQRLPGLKAPHLLIGGYGMGYTLRAALAALGPKGQITVAELMPEVLDWARGPMADLTGESLSDPRVAVRLGDVAEAILLAPEPYDAILLDVDNGPDGLVRPDNNRLYTRAGLEAARAALTPGGLLTIWSAAADPAFTRRLEKARFDVEVLTIRARPNGKGPRHTLWFARKG